MTILPGPDTYGRVITFSEEERGFFNADQHRHQATIGLGALAIENYLGLVVGSGVSGDTKGATELVVNLVEKLGQHPGTEGVSWVGPVNLDAVQSSRGSSYSESTMVSPVLLEYFDRIESRMLHDCYQNALEILGRIDKLEIYALAARFAEAQTWTGKQFEVAYSEIVGKSQTYRQRREGILSASEKRRVEATVGQSEG
jgi:ATP-dependent Zn protease